jgi:hypothetical protein
MEKDEIFRPINVYPVDINFRAREEKIILKKNF